MSNVPNDGSGRDPRPVQVEVYNDILSSKAQVVAVNAPPGLGKSFLLRALQRDYGRADILTSDNSLVSQYVQTYPELNSVLGKDNYDTSADYHKAHKLAQQGSPSIYNPLSHYYARQRGLREPNLLGIDEAHLLVDKLTYLSAHVIPVSRTQVPEDARNEGDLIKWCYRRYDRLLEALSKPDAPGALYKEFESIARLKASLEEGSQNQVFEISKAMVPVGGRRPQKCLVLTPVRIPLGLIRSVTAANKVVALSGTMTRFDAIQLAAGRTLEYLQRPYLTPKENRPVYYSPVPPELRRDPVTLAAKIREIYLANPVPTLVHVTYDLQQRIGELLLDLKPLLNKPHNKAQVKKKFVQGGGIWLAAGCSEGLDLPYEQCQQVVIPLLMFPDRGDLFVQKRVGMADGDYWYRLRTIQNTTQRLGRGLRAEDDHCIAHILDPAFPRTFEAVKDEFAAMNIIWEKQ